VKSISVREVRVVLVSLTVSVVLGAVIALSLAILLGGAMPRRWDLLELISQVPAALLFGLVTSISVTVPLGLLGGLVAVFVLRQNRLPRETWMLRGCVLGAAMGFLPVAAWDIIIERANDALIFPVLCGMGGAWVGAIVGSVLRDDGSRCTDPERDVGLK
jgi:predicted lysophospholipase L1 biosynthesis ABC-type transport system permease subunit